MPLKTFIAELSGTTKLIIVAGLALLVSLLLWYFGGRISNSVSSWWFARGTAETNVEIQQLKDEAAKQKMLAQEAINAFNAQQLVTVQEKQKREALEVLLEDKTRTTDQKLKIYNDLVAHAPTVTAPESTDQLCARARELGVYCGP